jgi:hypothetical protein
LKLTASWTVPRFVPVIVTRVPIGPLIGLKLVMLGTGGATGVLVRLKLAGVATPETLAVTT